MLCPLEMGAIIINFCCMCFALQATYDEVKAALRTASEDPTLGKYVGYTEDQVGVQDINRVA